MKGKNTDIAIVGAGGMGALFGSILSENGLDVVLIDPNREHVEYIESVSYTHLTLPTKA